MFDKTVYTILKFISKQKTELSIMQIQTKQVTYIHTYAIDIITSGFLVKLLCIRYGKKRLKDDFIYVHLGSDAYK